MIPGFGQEKDGKKQSRNVLKMNISMNLIPKLLSRFRIVWDRRRSTLFAIAIGVLTVFALLKLDSEFYRLV